MTILPVLDAAIRSQRQLDALARLAADAERTVAELSRVVDIPAIRRMQADLQPTVDLARRMQQEIAASLPSKETLARFQASLPSPDVLAAFQSTNGDAQRQAHEAMLTTVPDTQRMLDQMRTMFEPSRRLAPQFAAMEVPARELAGFAKRVEASWLHSAEQLIERARLAERQVDRHLAKLLLARGWLGVERHLTTWELSRLLEVRGRNRGVSIDKFICLAFRRKNHARVASMMRAWWRIPYLKNRQRLIRQAIRAHRRKEYALSITTLLPLVDGLADEIRQRNAQQVPIVSGSGKRRKQRLIAVGDVVALYDPQRRVRDWADVVIEEVSKRMFADYDFQTQPPPAKLNRHGILHGRIVDYASEANSLKTLLMLDVMAHIAACVK